jgi:hypothetical protein
MSMSDRFSRRQFLHSGASVTGGMMLHRWASPLFEASQAPASRAAGIAQAEKMRAATGAQPIASQKLTDAVPLLSGPGGNVLVLHALTGSCSSTASSSRRSRRSSRRSARVPSSA